MTDAIILLFLCVLLFFALHGAKKRLKGGCCAEKGLKIKPQDSRKSHYNYRVTVYINGMTCTHCKAKIENAFNALPACMAKVHLKRKYAVIYSKAHLCEDEIFDTIQKNGYTPVKCIYAD